MARVVWLVALVVTVPACGGGLSSTSTEAAGQVAADGLFYGAMALASAGRAPTDHRPTYSEAEDAYGPPLRDFVCLIAGDEELVEARTLEGAQRRCGGPEECDCVDPELVDDPDDYWR